MLFEKTQMGKDGVRLNSYYKNIIPKSKQSW